MVQLGSETKQGDVLSIWLPLIGPEQLHFRCKMEGRDGGCGNAQEAGMQVLRIPDTTATTGPANTELTDGADLSVLAGRAQVDPQLHWTFLFVVINGPCIENTRVSN